MLACSLRSVQDACSRGTRCRRCHILRVLYTYAYVLWRKSGAVAGVIRNMQNQKFDHALVLKMTTKMRDDIERALILVQDTLIRSRTEFIRAACQFALDRLAAGCGDVPVDVGERKSRVLSGGDDLDAEGSDQVSASADNDYPEPRCA